MSCAAPCARQLCHLRSLHAARRAATAAMLRDVANEISVFVYNHCHKLQTWKYVMWMCFIMMSLMICSDCQILLGWSNQSALDGRGMWLVWGRKSVCRFLMGKVEGKRMHGRSRHGWGDNIKINLNQKAWEGLYEDEWWSVVMNFMFHKIWGTSWLPEQPLASQDSSAPCS
jgi:hypothetical protein